MRIDGPVAETGAVVIARAEPAVIHDKALDAESGGECGESLLALFGDVEGGGFPGVVEDGAKALSRENFIAGKAVKEAEAPPKPPAVKPA